MGKKNKSRMGKENTYVFQFSFSLFSHRSAQLSGMRSIILDQADTIPAFNIERPKYKVWGFLTEKKKKSIIQ